MVVIGVMVAGWVWGGGGGKGCSFGFGGGAVVVEW